MNIKKLYFIPTAIISMFLIITGCDELLPAPPKGEENYFIDERNDRKYKTIEIGNQIWMAENLAFSIDSGIGCWGKDTLPKDSTYGYLYTWETAKNAVPDGWRLPTKEDWEELIEYLGGSDVAGGRMKENSTEYWEYPNTEGTNSSGFTARPAGYKSLPNSADKELFLGEGRWGYWWSSTLDSSSFIWAVRLHHSEASAIVNDFSPRMAFSVRCVKD